MHQYWICVTNSEDPPSVLLRISLESHHYGLTRSCNCLFCFLIHGKCCVTCSSRNINVCQLSSVKKYSLSLESSFGDRSFHISHSSSIITGNMNNKPPKMLCFVQGILMDFYFQMYVLINAFNSTGQWIYTGFEVHSWSLSLLHGDLIHLYRSLSDNIL